MRETLEQVGSVRDVLDPLGVDRKERERRIQVGQAVNFGQLGQSKGLSGENLMAAVQVLAKRRTAFVLVREVYAGKVGEPLEVFADRAGADEALRLLAHSDVKFLVVEVPFHG